MKPLAHGVPVWRRFMVNGVDPKSPFLNEQDFSPKILRGFADDAVLFDIDEAGKTMNDAFERGIYKDTDGAIATLPTCIPPYPVMFCEYGMKAQAIDTEGIVGRQIPHTYVGALLITEPTPKAMPLEDTISLHAHPDGWVTTGFPFSFGLTGETLFGPFGAFRAAFDKDGNLFTIDRWPDLEDTGENPRARPSVMIRYPTAVDLSEEMMAVSNISSAMTVSLFACSLMHCKNVEYVEVRPSRQERREAERRNREPVVYKTLTIKPMRKAVSAEEQASIEQGHKRRLHIARGHFAEYGPEFGRGKLFGKISGRFWVPAHVRGDAEVGRVVKDYRVQP